jgi:hypothetical protein
LFSYLVLALLSLFHARRLQSSLESGESFMKIPQKPDSGYPEHIEIEGWPAHLEVSATHLEVSLSYRAVHCWHE